MSAAKQGARLTVRQIKSGIGYNKKQKRTLAALGLGKIDRVREYPDNPQVRGMLFKISHLVRIEGQ